MDLSFSDSKHILASALKSCIKKCNTERGVIDSLYIDSTEVSKFQEFFLSWWKFNLADFGLGLVEPMEAKNAERSQS